MGVGVRHLGVLILKLGQQFMRFSQQFVTLLKTGLPTKEAAEPQETYEVNLKTNSQQVAAKEGLLARIKGSARLRSKNLAAKSTSHAVSPLLMPPPWPGARVNPSVRIRPGCKTKEYHTGHPVHSGDQTSYKTHHQHAAAAHNT